METLRIKFPQITDKDVKSTLVKEISELDSVQNAIEYEPPTGAFQSIDQALDIFIQILNSGALEHTVSGIFDFIIAKYAIDHIKINGKDINLKNIKSASDFLKVVKDILNKQD
ncbi:hypothetical protein [Glaciecola sp. 1036]|uniref:hypothetical protein n=1 Tax=Alteromonadaceae TaxID=72275 RepID=UPI003D02D898